LKGELWRLARQARRSASPGPLASEAASRRTVRQLLDAAEKRNEAEERRVEERRRAQREAAEKKHAAERQKHLDALATREAAAWREVESLIQLKQPAKYDEAVTLIRDLLDVARRKKRESEALDRVRALREKHARKPSLMERLDRAGLGG
jgi:FtsZ-interacting cell division protein YlmF